MQKGRKCPCRSNLTSIQRRTFDPPTEINTGQCEGIERSARQGAAVATRSGVITVHLNRDMLVPARARELIQEGSRQREIQEIGARVDPEAIE